MEYPCSEETKACPITTSSIPYPFNSLIRVLKLFISFLWPISKPVKCNVIQSVLYIQFKVLTTCKVIANSQSAANPFYIVPQIRVDKMELLSVFTDTRGKNPLKINFIIKSVFIAYKSLEETWTAKEETTITHPHLYTHPNRAEVISLMFG